MEHDEFQALTTEEAFRKAVQDQFSSINDRLTKQDEVLAKAAENSVEMLAAFNVVKGGWVFLVAMGKLAKLLGYFLAVGAAVWALRNGKFPSN